jgi:hypothetical protein
VLNQKLGSVSAIETSCGFQLRANSSIRLAGILTDEGQILRSQLRDSVGLAPNLNKAPERNYIQPFPIFKLQRISFRDSFHKALRLPSKTLVAAPHQNQPKFSPYQPITGCHPAHPQLSLITAWPLSSIFESCPILRILKKSKELAQRGGAIAAKNVIFYYNIYALECKDQKETLSQALRSCGFSRMHSEDLV